MGDSALSDYEIGTRQTEVDYWIRKKVGMKRLIQEGMPGGQCNLLRPWAENKYEQTRHHITCRPKQKTDAHRPSAYYNLTSIQNQIIEVTQSSDFGG